jgi:hypothetical protein
MMADLQKTTIKNMVLHGQRLRGETFSEHFQPQNKWGAGY